jgi:hypothetical protein
VWIERARKGAWVLFQSKSDLYSLSGVFLDLSLPKRAWVRGWFCITRGKYEFSKKENANCACLWILDYIYFIKYFKNIFALQM